MSSDTSLRNYQLSVDFVSGSGLATNRAPEIDPAINTTLPRFELTAAAEKSDSRKKENIVEIEDVGKRIGWWQQSEYKKLGVERIRLGDHSVVMELQKPIKKSAIVMTLEIDKLFAFNFERGQGKWELNNVRGLKIGGDSVSAVEITPNKKVAFWMNPQKTEKQEYGKQAAEFIKALADPLMADYLRR